MPRIFIEACCGSADDAVLAFQGGADRVELNAALFLGGLTPSVGSLAALRRVCGIPVMAMLRPREGGFCYTALEYESMLADARALMKAGADGLVFGCLTEAGEIDAARVRNLVQLAEGRQTVFHRAIDVVPDWKRALDTLISLGVTRVLTSGQAASAPEGWETIAEMLCFAGNAIEILPGAGVRPENARQLVERTGCTQLHLSARRAFTDSSVRHGAGIRFCGSVIPPEDTYRMTDPDVFAKMRALFE